MHILIALCLSVLVAWSFRKAHKQDKLGHTRFIAASLGVFWPYLDRPVTWLLGTEYAIYQGTVTWSFIMAPFVAWGLSLVLCYVLKGYEPESPYVSRRFFVPIIAGLGLTIVLGLFSEKGVAVFAPFWFGKFSFYVLHSFDIGLLVATLMLTLLVFFVGKLRTFAARGVLLVLFLYVGVVGTFKLKAIQVGKAYGQATGALVTDVYTLPQALSPFYWHIIVVTADARLHSTKVSLKRANPLVITPKTNAIRRAKAVYMPTHKAVWHIYSRFGQRNALFAKQAWEAGFKELLYQRGHFVVLRKKAPYGGMPCAWFRDLSQERINKQFALCQKTESKKWYAYEALPNKENYAAGEALRLLDIM